MVFALGESPQGVNVRRLQFGRPALGWPRSNSDDQRDTSEFRVPGRRVGDLQQGQGRFVVRQILGDDR